MRTFVLILLPAAALVVWAIVEERKLRAMDSGAGKAMQQVVCVWRPALTPWRRCWI